jgi:hypothetical protein
MRQSIRWIRATSMMERNDRDEMGDRHRSNRSDHRCLHSHIVDSCLVAQLTWVPARDTAPRLVTSPSTLRWMSADIPIHPPMVRCQGLGAASGAGTHVSCATGQESVCMSVYESGIIPV